MPASPKTPMVLDTLGKLAVRGYCMFGHCIDCRRNFDVDMQQLVAERGLNCRLKGISPLRCPRCEGLRTEFRITAPSKPRR